jgi:pimeloyl-ACP methyl ester carboxylesterase
VQTICLLSGLLCDDAVWATQVHALRQHHDVKVMHFAGFDSIGAMAAHVLANMPDRFLLAGHSMGGRVALEVYRQAPERVQKLALLDTGFGPAAADEAEKRGVLVRKALTNGIDAIAETWACPMIAPCNLADEELLDSILNMVGRMSGEIYAGQTRALLTRPDATPVLPGIHCPTLVLCGKQDTWSPPERHERMAASIPGSTLRLIDDCGHMSTMEQPDEVLASLEEWIAMTPHYGDKTNEYNR